MAVSDRRGCCQKLGSHPSTSVFIRVSLMIEDLVIRTRFSGVLLQSVWLFYTYMYVSVFVSISIFVFVLLYIIEICMYVHIYIYVLYVYVYLYIDCV